MNEKKSFLEKVKEHKTEIIIAGLAIVSIAGIVMLTKNCEIVKDKTVTSLLKKGAKIRVDGVPDVQSIAEKIVRIEVVDKIVDVNKHIRTLPTGYTASLEKMLTANENGFRLEAGQTWVDAYSKMCA